MLKNVDVASIEEVNAAYDNWVETYSNQIKDLAKELNVSEDCANDIIYLRSRDRHSEELEKELIRLHSLGTPPNIFDFGVTPESQKNLMETVCQMLLLEGITLPN